MKSTEIGEKSTKIVYTRFILGKKGSVRRVVFGERLKALRKAAGLTQQQLGERVGVTKTVISFYELQERAPSPGVLVKLSRVFHVTTDYLLGLDQRETVDVTGLEPEDVLILQMLTDSLRRKKQKELES